VVTLVASRERKVFLDSFGLEQKKRTKGAVGDTVKGSGGNLERAGQFLKNDTLGVRLEGGGPASCKSGKWKKRQPKPASANSRIRG